MPDSILISVRPCAKCGTAERFKDGKCKLCKHAYSVARRAKNKDKIKIQNAAWKAANPERVAVKMAEWRTKNADEVRVSRAAWRVANLDLERARDAAYRKANPEKVKATTAAWRAANPGSSRINQGNRRAYKKKCGGKLSKGLAQKLFLLQKGKCPCCAQPLGDDCHLDHKMPLALGGSNTDDNMQLLRKTCNLSKHAQHPVDFMQKRGFLL